MSLVWNVGGVLTPQTEAIANWARDDEVAVGDRASLFSKYRCPPLQRKLSERHETVFESRYMENFFERPNIALVVRNWDCANSHCHQALTDTSNIESVFEAMVILEHRLVVMHMLSSTTVLDPYSLRALEVVVDGCIITICQTAENGAVGRSAVVLTVIVDRGVRVGHIGLFAIATFTLFGLLGRLLRVVFFGNAFVALRIGVAA